MFFSLVFVGYCFTDVEIVLNTDFPRFNRWTAVLEGCRHHGWNMDGAITIAEIFPP